LIIFKAFCGAFFKWLNAFIEYLPSGASNMYQNFLKKSVDVEVPENFKYIMYERFQESLDEYDSIIKSDLEKLTQFLVSNNLTTELSFELDQFYLKNQVKVSKEALEESGPKDYVREEKGGCLGVIVLLIIVTILISFG
jgi:hypothetical protein